MPPGYLNGCLLRAPSSLGDRRLIVPINRCVPAFLVGAGTKVSGRRVQGRRSRSPCDGPQGRPRCGGREPDNGHRERRPPRPGGFGLWEMPLAVGRRGRAGRASQGRARRGEHRTRRRRRRLEVERERSNKELRGIVGWRNDPVVYVRNYNRGNLWVYYASLGCGWVGSRRRVSEMLLGEAEVAGLRPCSSCGHMAVRSEKRDVAA